MEARTTQNGQGRLCRHPSSVDNIQSMTGQHQIAFGILRPPPPGCVCYLHPMLDSRTLRSPIDSISLMHQLTYFYSVDNNA